MGNNNISVSALKTSSYNAWPTRDGQSGALAISLPKTGQTTCYDASGNVISCTNTGQDGDLRTGAAWPNPRFTDNGDQTITDNLTGLIWTKDANLMKTRDPGFDVEPNTGDGDVSWQHALDYINKLNLEKYRGYNDWRLPNWREQRSLANDGQGNSSTWLNSQGFTNAQTIYWSSTSYTSSPSNAWYVSMGGGMNNRPKTESYFIWPVRGGQSGPSLNKGTISGRVSVNFAGNNDLNVKNASISIQGTQFSVQTDSNGNFILANIPFGTYNLLVTAPGMNSITQSVILTGQTLAITLPQMVVMKGDTNEDGQLGLDDAIYILQILSGARE